MNTKQRLLLFLLLACMAGSVGALNWLKNHRKLGQPGIKAAPIPGSVVMNIDLPEAVLDYSSTNLAQADIVTNTLPSDTSYAQRLYLAPDGFYVVANIILMGADRTSIHKPDYCLAGQGFQVVEKAVERVPIAAPQRYELPVAKWIGSKIVEAEGRKVEARAVYVFWFVADQRQEVDNTRRILSLYLDQLRTGVLQRWAYVSFLSVCAPGQEAATFERMKELIAVSVPEFQLPPPGAAAPAVAEHSARDPSR